jgi:hypothetical protein
MCPAAFVNIVVGEHDMIWTFSRGKERIRIENHYDKQAGEFVLQVDHPGGHRETKRFADVRAFRAWLSAFEDQLEARQWRPAPALAEGRDGLRRPEVPTVMMKTYTIGIRMFEVRLSQRTVNGLPAWTVERVMETNSRNKRVTIPRMQSISTTTVDETFARACDCIDKWLWTAPRP